MENLPSMRKFDPKCRGRFSFGKCCEPFYFGGYPKVSESPAISENRPILVTLADDHGVQQQANKRACAPVQAERLPRRISTSPIRRRVTPSSICISSPLRHIGTTSHLALPGRTMFVNRHNKGRSCSSVEFEATDKTKGSILAHSFSTTLDIMGCRSAR